MTYPFSDECRITDDYQAQRPRGLHRAWDVTGPKGSAIVAPERGSVILHLVLRSHPHLSTDVHWPDGRFYWFSRYYADRYGGLVILDGEQHRWAFCHVDAAEIFRLAFHKAIDLDYGKLRLQEGNSAGVHYEDAERWFRWYLNLEERYVVGEGQFLCIMGDEGYSTGVHTHMEAHPAGGWAREERIDPATIWPDRGRA